MCVRPQLTRQLEQQQGEHEVDEEEGDSEGRPTGQVSKLYSCPKRSVTIQPTTSARQRQEKV